MPSNYWRSYGLRHRTQRPPAPPTHGTPTPSAGACEVQPEGSVRAFIAQAEHISAGNVFRLLERFGGDRPGALSLLPQEQAPLAEPHYLPVTPELIRAWFVNSRAIPLDLTGEQARMSLSGGQGKMAGFIGRDGSMPIPRGAAPSSHMIEPSMG